MKRCALLAVSILSVLLFTPASGRCAIGDVMEEFPTPCSTPTGLAFHQGSLWLADWESGSIYEIDPDGGGLRRTVEAPCFHPEGLASDGRLLYISDYEDQQIYVLDPETGQTVRMYGTPGDSPKGLAYGGGSLWLIDDDEDLLYELTPHDGTILNYYKTPHRYCRGLAHDGRYLWATDRIKDELYALEPSDGTVLFLVKTDGDFPCGLAFGDEQLWLVDFQSNSIRRLRSEADEPFRVTDQVSRDFRYQYRLRNDGVGTIRSAAIHLAVPYEQLENQTLIRDVSWSRPPDQVAEDRWGQRIAVFRFENLQPGAVVTAGYETRVRLGELHYAFDPQQVGGLDEVPKDLLEINTQATSRLQLDEELIQKSAREIVGTESNPYWMARRIYDWVREKLEYERIGGWDVPTTLIKRGTGSCSEYAFLYIALCRAAGLPARYEGSVVVRGDDASIDDVYHRWCEVYLPRIGWMPVDPSGGDQEWPADQARYFGGLSNRFLITTHGGGDSEYLGWGYNGHAEYVYEGKGSVHEEAYGIWSAVEEVETNGAPEAR